MPNRTFYVYILASHSRRLYVGITNNLQRRIYEHRSSTSSFCSRYRITKLVYFEVTSDPKHAIAWEKRLKNWRREKKLSLIERTNPGWIDLARDWFPSGTE